jgi:hypothetical protein
MRGISTRSCFRGVDVVRIACYSTPSRCWHPSGPFWSKNLNNWYGPLWIAACAEWLLIRRITNQWVIDFKSIHGFYMLQVVDHCSKKMWGKMFETKHCYNVAAYMHSLFEAEGGPPLKVQADNGGEFIGEVLQVVYRMWGVKSQHPFPYNPQANGMNVIRRITYFDSA